MQRFLEAFEVRYLDFETRLRHHRSDEDAAPLTGAERDELEGHVTRGVTQISRDIDTLTAAVMAERGAANANTTAFKLGAIKAVNEGVHRLAVRFQALQEQRYKAERRMRKTRLDEARALQHPSPVRLRAGSSSSPQRPASHGSPSQSQQGGQQDDAEAPMFALSPSELQTLSIENAALAAELNTMVDGVREAERQMVAIRQLQGLIAGHLSEQAEALETLLVNACDSTANVRAANAELATYRQSAGSYRLFMLVFLLGASLCLLFLNWYNG